VFWESKRQKMIALSTVESEYMVFIHATTQALWITKFFFEVGLIQQIPITIHADNNELIVNSTTDKHH